MVYLLIFNKFSSRIEISERVKIFRNPFIYKIRHSTKFIENKSGDCFISRKMFLKKNVFPI